MLPYLMRISLASRHASRRPLWATTLGRFAPYHRATTPEGSRLAAYLKARLAIAERPSGATHARVRASMLVMLE